MYEFAKISVYPNLGASSFLFLLGSLLPFSAQADVKPFEGPVPVQCTESYKVVGDTIVDTGYLSPFECYTSVRVRNSFNLVYRSFLFKDDGMLMIFNSFGDGPSSTDTGASEFMFFPRSEASSPVLETDGIKVGVQMSNGDLMEFNDLTGQPTRIGRGQIKVASKVEPNNKGGIEILNYDGLILDAGFRMGESPTFSRTRSSTFIDARGNRYRVKNTDIFTHSAQEHHFKFTDPELKTFLTAKCPNINWNL